MKNNLLKLRFIQPLLLLAMIVLLLIYTLVLLLFSPLMILVSIFISKHKFWHWVDFWYIIIPVIPYEKEEENDESKKS